ncbi:hypothetical protein ALO_20307 [Acetonema longum DSM 6540]|uniref:Uncharacterized protein n=1 Tax=Acetonema longum DSM 6540 TaxID=1009370 RepID=F7NPL6_9FIRM|nr:hypothetical protein ALO_20307 [Acetonema longum DSM 6540]
MIILMVQVVFVTGYISIAKAYFMALYSIVNVFINVAFANHTGQFSDSFTP